MESLLGTTLPVFISLTVFIMGFAAFMTGQALANTWRSYWHAIPYCFLFGFADRFLTWSLFDGELLSPSGYIIDSLVLLAIATIAFRLTQARRMVTQYPWMYERTGPFSWREKSAP